MVVTLGQQYNVGKKPAVILDTYINRHAGTPERHQKQNIKQCSVCVFSSHAFWTSSSLDVPAGVTQEEGHTRSLFYLLSAVRALSIAINVSAQYNGGFLPIILLTQCYY